MWLQGVFSDLGDMVARGRAGSHYEAVYFPASGRGKNLYRIKICKTLRTVKHVNVRGSWVAIRSDCLVERAVHRAGKVTLGYSSGGGGVRSAFLVPSAAAPAYPTALHLATQSVPVHRVIPGKPLGLSMCYYRCLTGSW